MMLDKPIQITEQNRSSGTVPLLSVFNWVYNHKDFIRESIESILVQKTTFPVEIIIHDDASNDGTKEIILEYQEKHPALFRNILHEENQWSQGKSVMTPLFEKPKGKYIALSHGDDYWTDPYKLQKQVDFLEGNEDLSMCFTNGISVKENNVKIDQIIPKDYHPNKFDTKYLISKDCRIPTASVVFRKNLLDLDLTGFPMGDYPMFYFLSKKGHIGYLSEFTMAYRIHQTSFLRSNSNKKIKRNQILCIQKILEKDKTELKTLCYNISVHYDELAGIEFREKNFKQFFNFFYHSLKTYPFRNLKKWRDTIYRIRKYE